MRDYDVIGFNKSDKKNKMYDAVLKSKNIKGYYVILPFGDTRYKNYWDLTGLNMYPHLIHGDKSRRKKYRSRHKVYLKQGYYSPGYFSFNYLW